MNMASKFVSVWDNGMDTEKARDQELGWVCEEKEKKRRGMRGLKE